MTHPCEFIVIDHDVPGPVAEERDCGEPASAKLRGVWFCEDHIDEAMDSRPAIAPRPTRITQHLVFLNLALGQFETPLRVNSSDFQIHFMTQHFGAPGRVVDLGRTYEIAIFAATTDSQVLSRRA